MEPLITKRVELIRALVRTKDQFDEMIDTGANSEVTEKEKEFMHEFKQIFHVGYSQLETFIQKIVDEGNDLDVESIEYYKSILLNGPFASKTRELTQDKPFFKRSTDIMGSNGNLATTNIGVPIFTGVPWNDTITVNNKSTKFINDIIRTASQQTSSVLNSASSFLTGIDNTKPFIDKRQGERRQSEVESGFNSEAHGCLSVKDVEFVKIVEDITQDIFDKVEEYLGESDFNIYKFKKLVNYFNAESNVGESFNAPIKRKLTYMSKSYDDNGKELIELKDTYIETDLVGNQFDSDKRREFEFKLVGDTDKIFKLNTIEGQLGSGVEVKEDPIAD